MRDILTALKENEKISNLATVEEIAEVLERRQRQVSCT